MEICFKKTFDVLCTALFHKYATKDLKSLKILIDYILYTCLCFLTQALKKHYAARIQQLLWYVLCVVMISLILGRHVYITFSTDSLISGPAYLLQKEKFILYNISLNKQHQSAQNIRKLQSPVHVI
jgi:hypothetical protein